MAEPSYPTPPPYVPTGPTGVRRRGLVALAGAVGAVGLLAAAFAGYQARHDDGSHASALAARADAGSTEAGTPTVSLPTGLGEALACLKDHGIDAEAFDPSGASSAPRPTSEEIAAAIKACVPQEALQRLDEAIVRAATLGGVTIDGAAPTIDQIKAQIADFQKCLADHGVDPATASGGRPDFDAIKAAAAECAPSSVQVTTPDGERLGLDQLPDKLDELGAQIESKIQTKLDELQKCLADHGIDPTTAASGGAVDLDQLKAAAKACLLGG